VNSKMFLGFRWTRYISCLIRIKTICLIARDWNSSWGRIISLYKIYSIRYIPHPNGPLIYLFQRGLFVINYRLPLNYL